MTTLTTPPTPDPNPAVPSGPAHAAETALLAETTLAEQAAVAEPLRYRLLTGPDDHAFCERVSAALAEGYRLSGGPAATFDGTRVIVAQAVVLDPPSTTPLQPWPEISSVSTQGVTP